MRPHLLPAKPVFFVTPIDGRSAATNSDRDGSAKTCFPALELLKWLGLAAMLVDHVARFVFNSPSSLSEHIGTFAFPFFAVALTAGLAQRNLSRYLCRRFYVGIVLAQLLWIPVVGIFPVNVLATLFLGVLVYEVERAHGPIPALALFLGSLFVEFGPFGVLMVYALRWSFHRLELSPILLALIAAIFLTPWNSGSPLAPVAVGMAYLVVLSPFGLPRCRGIFYYAYILQWPLLWLAGALVASSASF